MFLVAVPLTAVLAGCGSGSTASTTSAVNSPASPAATTPATNETPAAGTTSTPAATSSPDGTTPAGAAHGQPSTPSPAVAAKPKPEEQLGKTPFLAATGQAFAAFHEYVAKPFRKHVFSAAGGSRPAISKAATAATYASRELTAATAAAEASKDLSEVVAPLKTLQQNLAVIATGLKAGRVDAAAIDKARSQVDSISLKALEAGQPIQEVLPQLP
jgi:hypothetical protein